MWAHSRRIGDHNVKMRWVKAHATCESVLKGDISVLDLFGNACADALAGRAGKQADVFPQDAVNVLWCVDTARKIQKRAVSILIHLAAENKGKLDTGGEKVRKMAAISVGGLAVSSKHTLVMLGRSWHCSKCLEHRHCDSPVLAEWFATDCTPFVGVALARRVGLSRPCNLPDGAEVYAGRHLLHQSHVMALFRGLYYCKHCGYYASSAPKRLKQPCGGMSTQGRAMIARIQRGELPPGLKSWPSERVGSAPNLIEL